jgi:hypothetical protein
MPILGIIASSLKSSVALVAGYAFGGSPAAATIQKLNYSNETRTNLSDTFTAALGPTGVSDSGTAGYFQGDNVASNTAIRKLLFSTETGSTIGATIINRVFAAGVGNKGSAGYWMAGGPQTGGSEQRSDIQKLAYSNETSSTIGATMPAVTIYNYNGMSNDGTAGYSYGGYVGGANVNTIQKLLYSTEARTQLSATHTASLRNIITGSNSGSNGYAFGGSSDTDYFTTITKMPYSTETPANIAATLSVSNAGNSTCDAKTQATYILGGFNLSTGTPGANNIIAKLAFATDTRTNLAATMNANANCIGGVSNGSA